jgi:hypothetical protein
MRQFADFNNFIAFGNFVSIDLRVKVRNVTSGKLVKTFSVNTKLAEYTVLSDGTFDAEEVLVTLRRMIDDLAAMCNNSGFPVIGEHLSNLNDASYDVTGDESSSAGIFFLVGRLFALNHDICSVVWG